MTLLLLLIKILNQKFINLVFRAYDLIELENIIGNYKVKKLNQDIHCTCKQ